MLRALLAVWTITTAMNLNNMEMYVDVERPSIVITYHEEGVSGFYELYPNWEYLEGLNEIHNEVVDLDFGE